MKLFSYIVARDYGFAPNPFFGVCTIATCKPTIRRVAQKGNWIVGTGSRGYGLEGHLVYAMEVAETLAYDEYWEDLRFQLKKPNLRGSLKQAYGDNIYHRNAKTGEWLQENSHHSLPDGRPNQENVQHDTQTDRVLVGYEYVYWGGSGPLIPKRFRQYQGWDICCSGPGHKCNFPTKLLSSFFAWMKSIGGKDYISEPREFSRVG
ncbi:hypothetical protein MYX78_11845 [Acidobacteria bacterium AH-259-G07]|nr:hypothetical protein [Acidobacteria bacterium AH-259-G07]